MKVGTLVAELQLDASNYKKGMGEAEKEAARLAGDLKLISIGGTAAAAGLAAIAAAAIHATNRAGEFADQIRDVANVTGMSVEEVQRWKYAADQSGVSFEDLTTTMRMLTQNISSVEDENSELKKSLDILGVSAKDANGNFKDTSTLMKETLSALQKMDDPVKRNTLAMQLYGRSWAELADFMQKDVNLAQLMAKADPISAYHLKQADVYREKMGALGSEFDKIEVKVGTKLIPAFSGVAAAINMYVVPAISSFIDTVSRGITNMTILQLRSMDFLARAVGRTSNLEDQYNNMLAEEVRKSNASMSTPYFDTSPGGSGNPAGSAGYNVGTPGSGGGAGGSDRSYGNNIPADATASELSAWYNAGLITQSQFVNASKTASTNGMFETVVDPITGQRTTRKSSFVNPYAGNDGYYGARQYADNGTDISGSATQGGGVGMYGVGSGPDILTLATKLQRAPGVSAGVKSMLAQYFSHKYSGSNQPRQQFGAEYDDQGNPTGALRAVDMLDPYGWGVDDRWKFERSFQSEYSRLQGGSHPTIDSQGNVVVYVTIDGKEVAQAMVSKLALLGVKT